MPPSPTDLPPPVQLRLATGGPEPSAAALTESGLRLMELRDASRYLLDVAERRVDLDAGTIGRLRDALNTLSALAPLPGRLGYLARRLNQDPIAKGYDDIVDELAFAVHLADRARP
ncbi:MAG: hypothetical protein QOK39_2645 [Acidimicrobiaceae bacterium]|nr:hypothetical protein [Acidimicrobiaceae bacterium]